MRALLLSLCLAISAPVARACDIALVLAVDVSGSVDQREYRVQMDGLAAALRDGLIAEALVRADARVMLVQWTGSSRQKVTIPWMAMEDFAAVDRFADAVAADPRAWHSYSTAIGEALGFSARQFGAVTDCARRVIDLSGDGISNEGTDPRAVHAWLQAQGITVNAIAIEESEEDLTAWFYENVILGEGAFVETAARFDDYPAGIRRKLLREITKQTASRASGAVAVPVAADP